MLSANSKKNMVLRTLCASWDVCDKLSLISTHKELNGMGGIFIGYGTGKSRGYRTVVGSGEDNTGKKLTKQVADKNAFSLQCQPVSTSYHIHKVEIG